jgi:ribonuclease R
MKELLAKLTFGTKKKDLTKAELAFVDDLVKKKILTPKDELKFPPNIIVGIVDRTRSGLCFLESLTSKTAKDVPIDRRDSTFLEDDDIIIASIKQTRGRTMAKTMLVVEKSNLFSIVLVTKNGRTVKVKELKTGRELLLPVKPKVLFTLPDETVLKIDNNTKQVLEVLGVLSDPLVDEKISLGVYGRHDEFEKKCLTQAEAYGKVVDKSMYPNRTDLTALPFCTIDPIDAKDFDDAIYFDVAQSALYVAIADVSQYVTPFTPLDEEAKYRGFSVYLPHRSIPMLPRNLSENICSLKEKVDRLTFTFKMRIDPDTLEVTHFELFESVINSARRYHYDEIDEFFGGKAARDETDTKILAWLLPLNELTEKLKEKRLKKGFNFASTEIRMTLDEAQHIIGTKIEEQTRSHSLIEDCMLLANICSATYFDYGIFRCHDKPSRQKLVEMVESLDAIGFHAKLSSDIHAMVEGIQAEAKGAHIEKFVDKLIIQSQQKALYQTKNIGHFGLGFERYSHFTSPIRRYSDLMLHRLLKEILRDRKPSLVLHDIEAVTLSVSALEREAARVEWDFKDRKFARWAMANIGAKFGAVVEDIDERGDKDTILRIQDVVFGARVFAPQRKVSLFEEVRVEIVKVDIATAKIYGNIVA